MNTKEFIEKFAEAIEADAENLSVDTKFRSLEEWSSLTALSIIAMFDEEFGKELVVADFKKAQTIGDLMNLLN